ncbi:sulfatase-like hydrolase/transferase [Sorangium sp. So ce131]|uniref:sulfatase-like hydrolase/transferase n=1 Tax=Sorangium sp. So ce131 TaxID=3133282 RepID=UPI003F5D97E7
MNTAPIAPGAAVPTLARAFAARLARSALGASAFGALAASLDAGWAVAGAGEDPTLKLATYLADIGVITPVALAAGLLAGVAAIAADPSRPPSPATLVASLRLRAIGRPADIAAFVPLAVLAAFLWMTLCAHLARALLGLEAAPLLVGTAIAAGSLGLGLIAGLAVLALTPPLRRALANASDGRPACVDPAVTGGVALGVAAALFAFGVATGGVSGEGGLFGIYGVFKRPELDLRAPAILLVVALAAFLAQAAARTVRAPLALVLALLPLGLTARAASSLGAEPAVAQAIERGAPLGSKGLAILRRAADRDGDRAAALFGGGDCDDRNPRVHPLAEEILDNGVDDDCSGGDLTAAKLAELTPARPAAPAPSPEAAARVPADLNVVLITIDTLRWDLGYAGNPRPVSPNLDALAARSTVFERAYALASYTGKSIGPMLIGKYGSETHRNWGHFNKFGAEDTFVAERLKGAGVRAMSVHGHRYFGSFGGLDRGFDVVDMSAAPPEGAPWDVDNKATSPALTDAALRLLAAPENTGGRFFLWVHYLDPHADYLRHDDPPGFGTASQRDLYDGEVAFTDKHIGRLLDAIAAAPFGKRTAIVVTSDHGEAFGEHKMFRHGFELWEELVRVPLIVHVPGAPPSRVQARRSLIDLAPTLLDLMRVPGPAEGAPADDFLSGVSLLPDVLLAPGEQAAAHDVLIDMPAGPYNDARRSFLRGDLKLTISGGARFELYDLANDPEERKNLWGTPAAKETGKQAEIELRYAAQRARLREVQVTGARK